MKRNDSSKHPRAFRNREIRHFEEDDWDWDDIEHKVSRAFRKQNRRINKIRKTKGKRWFRDEL